MPAGQGARPYPLGMHRFSPDGLVGGKVARMTTPAAPSGHHSAPKWQRWSGLTRTPASQWSTRRRIFIGIGGAVLTATVLHRSLVGPHPRRAWFGGFGVLVYVYMYGTILFNPGRHERWTRRHRYLEATLFGPLAFIALGVTTPLPLGWCALAAAAGLIALLALALLLGRRQSRPA